MRAQNSCQGTDKATNCVTCAQVASAHRLGKEHYARRVAKALFDAFLQVLAACLHAMLDVVAVPM